MTTMTLITNLCKYPPKWQQWSVTLITIIACCHVTPKMATVKFLACLPAWQTRHWSSRFASYIIFFLQSERKVSVPVQHNNSSIKERFEGLGTDYSTSHLLTSLQVSLKRTQIHTHMGNLPEKPKWTLQSSCWIASPQNWLRLWSSVACSVRQRNIIITAMIFSHMVCKAKAHRNYSNYLQSHAL